MNFQFSNFKNSRSHKIICNSTK